MEYTYLDYFNYYLKEFLNELVNTYPQTRNNILSNYRDLLEGRGDKNDIYVKFYYTKINNFLQQIAKRDATIFENSLVFIEGVDISSIWNSPTTTDDNRNAIWKYLQILMLLGRRVIPNNKEIIELLEKISKGDINVPAKVERTLVTESVDEDEKAGSVFGLGDIASSLGGLGNLASGLGDIGGIFNGVKEMLNNPDFTNAMSQLGQQFAAGMPTGTTNETTSDTTTASENTTSETTTGEDVPTSGEATGSTQQPTPDGLFNNPLFSDLAKEVSETFNFDEMEKDGKPANVAEALGKFMSGNNPAKLMGLIGKFGSKLQENIKNGGINPAQLLQQTMGGMTPEMRAQMEQMQQQMGGAAAGGHRGAAPMGSRNGQRTTLERLRQKVADKQAKENESK